MSPEDILHDIYRTWADGDIEAMLAHYADNIEYVARDGTIKGKQAYSEHIRSSYGAWSDWRVEGTWVFGSATCAAGEAHLSMVHSSPLTLPDRTVLAPSGQRVFVDVASLLEMEGDFVVREHEYSDRLQLGEQLSKLASEGRDHQAT
jgi:ketosteroid isomerase-like protein